MPDRGAKYVCATSLCSYWAVQWQCVIAAPVVKDGNQHTFLNLTRTNKSSVLTVGVSLFSERTFSRRELRSSTLFFSSLSCSSSANIFERCFSVSCAFSCSAQIALPSNSLATLRNFLHVVRRHYSSCTSVDSEDQVTDNKIAGIIEAPVGCWQRVISTKCMC